MVQGWNSQRAFETWNNPTMLKDVENQIVKSNLGIVTRLMILFATLQDV